MKSSRAWCSCPDSAQTMRPSPAPSICSAPTATPTSAKERPTKAPTSTSAPGQLEPRWRNARGREGQSRTMSTHPTELSATALLEHYRRKTLSPVEVTRAVLDRIAALQPSLNAFLLVDEENALAA